MKLFSLINDKVKTVSSKDFRLEKDIQNLIEKDITNDEETYKMK